MAERRPGQAVGGWSVLLFAHVLGGLVGVAHAVPPVDVPPGLARIDLASHMDLLEDEHDELVVFELVRRRSELRPVPRGRPALGLSGSSFWVRLRLRNRTTDTLQRWLVIRRASLADVEVFIGDGLGFDRKHLTRQTPFGARDYPHRTPVFRVDLRPRAHTTVYVKISSDRPLVFPMSLMTDRELARHVGVDSIVTWLLRAVVVVTALLCLLLFVRRRQAAAMYLMLAIGSAVIWQWFAEGAAYGAASGLGSNVAGAAAGLLYLATAFALLFTRSVLQSHRHAPALDRVALIGAELLILVGLWTAAAPSILASYAGLLVWCVSGVAALAVSLRCSRGLSQRAPMLAGTWGLVLCLALLDFAVAHGWLPLPPHVALEPGRLVVASAAVFASAALLAAAPLKLASPPPSH